MGRYDTQQVCLNGHQITVHYHASPEFRREYCTRCGARTIYQCPEYSTEIKGDYDVPGVAVIGFSTPIPTFCESCGTPFPWADELGGEKVQIADLDPLEAVERICTRFPLVVRQLRLRHKDRQTLDIEDEYDVQDLLHSLLLLFFDDVRPEEYTPSYAGRNSRIDFLLKNESIVVEAKMTRRGLGAKEIGEQLIIDIARYQSHPQCKTLICLVYDPEHRITNPRGIERDLSRQTDDLLVKVFIVPRGS